jgi:hypothetical protein
MDTYNEFPKIDPAVFINTVNAEIATIQKNLDKLFDSEFPRYRDFLDNCGETQDEQLTEFIETVTQSLDEIEEKDCRNEATDLNNDIDNCTEDNYDEMTEQWSQIKENYKALQTMEAFLFKELQNQNFLTKGRTLIENATFLKGTIEFLTQKANGDYNAVCKKLDDIKYEGMVIDTRNEVAEKWNTFNELINGDDGLIL